VTGNVSNRCGGCGRALEEPTDTPVESRTPCPDCGSTARDPAASIQDSMPVTDDLKLERGRPTPIHIDRRETLWAALGALLIVAAVAFPWPASLLGVGEWGRLAALLVAAGAAQLVALLVGWVRVARRLREPTMLGLGPVAAGDAARAVVIAEENDRRIIQLIADFSGGPVVLFALGVLLATWAAVWWLGMGA
jgi:hypothetical protein